MGETTTNTANMVGTGLLAYLTARMGVNEASVGMVVVAALMGVMLSMLMVPGDQPWHKHLIRGVALVGAALVLSWFVARLIGNLLPAADDPYLPFVVAFGIGLGPENVIRAAKAGRKLWKEFKQ